MAGIRKKDDELKLRIVKCIDDFFLANHRSPYMSEIATELKIAKSTAYRYVCELDRDGVLKYNGSTIVTELIDKTDDQSQFAPISGKIACGSLTEVVEDFEGFIALPTAIFGTGDLFILKTKGLSMIDAGIEEGDMVVFRRDVYAQEGDIVAFMDRENGTSTLKRIHFCKDQRIILHPENHEMENIVIPRRDLYHSVILGVAQHVIKKL